MNNSVLCELSMGYNLVKHIATHMNKTKLSIDERKLLAKLESGQFESVLTQERRAEIQAIARLTRNHNNTEHKS